MQWSFVQHLLVRVQHSSMDTIKQSVLDRSGRKWKGSQWLHQAMDLSTVVTALSQLDSYLQEKLKPPVGNKAQAFQTQYQILHCFL